MKVRVESRSGRELVKGGLDLSDDASVKDLQATFHKNLRKYYPSRQRWTLPLNPGEKKPTVLDASKKLSDYGSPAVLIFKDLGMQVGWSTVFVLEYLGPLLIYPLFYLYPEVCYPWAQGKSIQRHTAQTYALAAWTFHYSKRILETLFVHRYSHATMGIYFLVKNCTYYWSFGAFVSYFLNHPYYLPPSDNQVQIGLLVFVVAQLSNFYCHIILRGLRGDKATGAYQIPRGFLFEYVTCANYTTEIWAWIGFNIATQTLGGWLFITVGSAQMFIWALQKHTRLRKLFDGKDGRPKYPRRFVAFPPFF